MKNIILVSSCIFLFLLCSTVLAKEIKRVVITNSSNAATPSMNWCLAAEVGPNETIVNTKGKKYKTNKSKDGYCSAFIPPGDITFNTCYLTGFSRARTDTFMGCNYDGDKYEIRGDATCYFACQYILP